MSANKWISHVRDFADKNKCTYKEAMVLSKESYKGVAKVDKKPKAMKLSKQGDGFPKTKSNLLGLATDKNGEHFMDK